MSNMSFESAISAMTGDTEQRPTLIERIIEDVIKHDIKVNIQFTEKYDEIINYIKNLGWTPNCSEWDYGFDNSARLKILSTSYGYTLTVSMQKVPVVKYAEVKTFISPYALTWSKAGDSKFVLCRYCNTRIAYEDADLTYKGMDTRGTYSYWCRCPECKGKFTIHQWGQI